MVVQWYVKVDCLCCGNGLVRKPVLGEELTAEEHLWFYACFKGQVRTQAELACSHWPYPHLFAGDANLR